MQGLRKILSVILIMAILGAIGVLGYFIMTPKLKDNFTEFYTLGPSDKATDYPRDISRGEEVRVIIGIVNHEQQVVSYRIEVRIDGVKNNGVGAVVLANEQKWQEILSFTPDKAGDNQKVEFLLYRLDQNEVYRQLHLRINVKEQPLE